MVGCNSRRLDLVIWKIFLSPAFINFNMLVEGVPDYGIGLELDDL